MPSPIAPNIVFYPRPETGKAQFGLRLVGASGGGGGGPKLNVSTQTVDLGTSIGAIAPFTNPFFGGGDVNAYPTIGIICTGATDGCIGLTLTSAQITITGLIMVGTAAPHSTTITGLSTVETFSGSGVNGSAATNYTTTGNEGTTPAFIQHAQSTGVVRTTYQVITGFIPLRFGTLVIPTPPSPGTLDVGVYFGSAFIDPTIPDAPTFISGAELQVAFHYEWALA